MPEPLQNQRQRQSRLPRQTRLQPRTRLPNQRHPHQCTKTLQNHHHETVGARMARNRPDRPLRDREQIPLIPTPTPLKTLHRTEKQPRTIRKNSPMPHRPRVHRRIQTQLQTRKPI
jgi:hypothetical protein